MREPPRKYYVYVIEIYPRERHHVLSSPNSAHSSRSGSGRGGSAMWKGPSETGVHTVYVGQSANVPTVRFKEHVRGKRYCETCEKKHYVPIGHWVRLRKDLYQKYNPLPSREAAEKIEKHLAQVLRHQGYRVTGGH